MEEFQDRIDSIKFTVTASSVGPGGSFSRDRQDIICQQLDDIVRIFEAMREKCKSDRKEISRLKDKLEHAESALRKAEQRSIRHGFIDLYNYNGFALEYQRFSKALERGDFSHGVVAYFDLDGFKDINDRLGHDIANDILIELGDCVKNSIRPIDVGACLHGDEFAVLFPDADVTGAAIAMRRIQDMSKRIGQSRKDYSELMQRLGRDAIVTFTPGLFDITDKEHALDVKSVLHYAESVIPKFARKREGDPGFKEKVPGGSTV
jgi:diguanylate cyclase (GGDEF)-like protein